MAALADQVGNHPVLFSLLNRRELQGQQLAATEPAAEEHRDHRVVSQFPMLWTQSGATTFVMGHSSKDVSIQRTAERQTTTVFLKQAD